MITIHLMGGLGNQLFQIFAVLAYSLEHGHPYIFPYSETLKTGVERPTYWETLFHNMKTFTTITQTRGFTNQMLAALPQWREPGFNYTKIAHIPIDKNFTLYGYFQSPKYFESYKTPILQLLKIPDIQNTIRNQFAHYLDPSTHTISMHFRLGDYKYKQQHHPVISKEYYYRALNHIMSKLSTPNIKVLYFCEAEDNDYVTSVIDYLRDSVNRSIGQSIDQSVDWAKADDTIHDWQQLIFMSCCDSHIIANSSFSWWGAYLCNSNQTNNVVCYPSTWFGPAMAMTHRVDDLFPETWTKIQA